MDLEPDIRLLDDGVTVDLVADVTITGPGYSVVTTAIHKNSVLLDLWGHLLPDKTLGVHSMTASGICRK